MLLMGNIAKHSQAQAEVGLNLGILLTFPTQPGKSSRLNCKFLTMQPSSNFKGTSCQHIRAVRKG